ncbi:hypothetical protein IMSAGC005_03075 [Lachnospiraceae bacterium]|nr:hypothetical protein IMSAGC005_03075 [Lachnospiraceae bacterium]
MTDKLDGERYAQLSHMLISTLCAAAALIQFAG